MLNKRLFFCLLLCFGESLAHRTPKTDHEIEVQRALQAAAYHVRHLKPLKEIGLTQEQCAPAVESFTASRKRAWAQRALAGMPGVPGQQHLFSSETYADLEDKAHNEQDDTLMNCTPISDTHIQNNTCVLAPEVTEGPYYHTEGHIIRQNMAEHQDGLLLVSASKHVGRTMIYII